MAPQLLVQQRSGCTAGDRLQMSYSEVGAWPTWQFSASLRLMLSVVALVWFMADRAADDIEQAARVGDGGSHDVRVGRICTDGTGSSDRPANCKSGTESNYSRAREKTCSRSSGLVQVGRACKGTNAPELLDQEGGPMQPTWNSTLSRSAFGLACSDVAVPRRAGW